MQAASEVRDSCFVFSKAIENVYFFIVYLHLIYEIRSSGRGMPFARSSEAIGCQA